MASPFCSPPWDPPSALIALIWVFCSSSHISPPQHDMAHYIVAMDYGGPLHGLRASEEKRLCIFKLEFHKYSAPYIPDTVWWHIAGLNRHLTLLPFHCYLRTRITKGLLVSQILTSSCFNLSHTICRKIFSRHHFHHITLEKEQSVTLSSVVNPNFILIVKNIINFFFKNYFRVLNWDWLELLYQFGEK